MKLKKKIGPASDEIQNERDNEELNQESGWREREWWW